MSFSKQEKQFLRLASAGVVVPQNTEITLAAALDHEESSLHTIKQRDVLFFDERLTVYVMLHVPQCPEEELRSYLSRLELKLEIWASSSTQTTTRSPNGTAALRDLIFSDVIKHNEDPILLVSQNEDDDDSIYLDLIWETLVTLNRPRVRLQDAHITFEPIALVAPVEESKTDEVYLDPFQPQVGNLFEPLKGSRGYEKAMPYLPVSRLTSVLPSPPKDDHTFHIRCISSPPIPTHLSFVTRLRYSKTSLDDIRPSIIASLDIEMIPFLEIHGRVVVAEAKLQKGTSVSFMNDMLPIACQAKDCVTFLYRLEQASNADSSFQSNSPIQIDILSITVRVELQLPGSCHPVVQMQWTTNAEFTQPLSMPGAFDHVVQRPGGTPNSSIDQKTTGSSQLVNMSLQPVSELSGPRGVTISFAAGSTPVVVGVPFSWQVLVVNRTNRPAKLAIIPLPRVQKPTTQVQQYAKRHATRSSIASIQTNERNTMDHVQKDIAQAVMDENILYAVQHSGAVPPEADIMSLTPELRVGPLGPGQCHEGEIRMVAFKSGAFTLDAIRVVDLAREAEQGYGGPTVVMDIRELPDVIVVDESTK